MRKERTDAFEELQRWNYECALWNSTWYQNQFKYFNQSYEKVTGNSLGSFGTDSNSESANGSNQGRISRFGGISATYDIPSFGVRLLAEIIDFLIVVIIKLIITNFILMYLLEIKLARNHLSFSYTFDELQLELFNLESAVSDDNLIDELTELLVIGGLHKLAVIFLEAYFLSGGRDGLGGCTPGKYFMGIRVIGCQSADSLGPEEALVTEASNLGRSRALLRSLIKNLAMTFFFPLVFSVMMYNNRTAYDVLSHSLVVYHPSRGPNRNNPNRN